MEIQSPTLETICSGKFGGYWGKLPGNHQLVVLCEKFFVLLTGGPVGLMSRAKLVRWKHWHTVMF